MILTTTGYSPCASAHNSTGTDISNRQLKFPSRPFVGPSVGPQHPQHGTAGSTKNRTQLIIIFPMNDNYLSIYLQWTSICIDSQVEAASIAGMIDEDLCARSHLANCYLCILIGSFVVPSTIWVVGLVGASAREFRTVSVSGI